MSVWKTDNPRPDTMRLWLVPRVCLLACLGGAAHWWWFAVVLAWIAADYYTWFSRRGHRPDAAA